MIVKNEARHLPACLAAVRDLADEIVILDSGSSDEGAAIAARFGARWYENRDWRGFGVQRQRAQALASGDYVLMLDADEQPDAALKAAIHAVAQQPPAPDRVYALRLRNIFCGTTMHRRYRDHIIRLYARPHFHYHAYEVHESLARGNATVTILDGDLLHFTNDNLAHFLAKNLRYSRDWALERAANGKRPPNLWALPLRAVALPIGVHKPACAVLRGDRLALIRTARIKDNNFIGDRRQPRQTAAQIRRLVLHHHHHA